MGAMSGGEWNASLRKSSGGGQPSKETEMEQLKGREENLECDVLRAPVGMGSLGPMSRRENSSSADRTGAVWALLSRYTNAREGSTALWPPPGLSPHTKDALSKGLES